jgi:hypothetical protein
VAGALDEQEYVHKLASAGFEAASVEPTRIYSADDARSFLESAGVEADRIATELDGKVMGAFIRATKPVVAASACCGTECCGGGR